MVSFFFFAALCSTISVPRMLVSMVRTGLSTIWKTPTEAARWNTTSAWSTSSATCGALKRASTTSLNFGLALSAVMFSAAPVERSSKATTSWPSPSSSSQRWEPMKPAPPVTR
jgi:hypothetical protein